MTNRIAVDVGGTFTDVIVLNEKTQKLRLEKIEIPPDNPVTGVLKGLENASTTFSRGEVFCAW
ncbi:MAG: hydantoinase/oxoprolinase N-terminal domain-containing protein [Halieaceae bacterium]|nr:hydantoinase/oxoprolinase N-terminal domain-containing protein [Halieaceae bacterium]